VNVCVCVRTCTCVCVRVDDSASYVACDLRDHPPTSCLQVESLAETCACDVCREALYRWIFAVSDHSARRRLDVMGFQVSACPGWGVLALRSVCKGIVGSLRLWWCVSMAHARVALCSVRLPSFLPLCQMEVLPDHSVRCGAFDPDALYSVLCGLRDAHQAVPTPAFSTGGMPPQLCRPFVTGVAGLHVHLRVCV
jgi:hypothetical protein